MIQNSPITAFDVNNANNIFGTNLAGTWFKTVQQKPDRVAMDFFYVPKYFIKLHKFVTIVSDVMFLNVAPLLITMSVGIKFVTVEHIPTCTDKQLSKYSKQVMTIYSRSGMIVQTVLMDTEFDKTIYEIMGNVSVNNSAAKEYVTEIERSICTSKQRARCIVTTINFKYPQNFLITNIV